MKISLTTLLCLLCVHAGAQEIDTIYLDGDVIEGNQELPGVLYILPWQALPGEPIPASPPDFSPADWLTPIYPDQHRRELEFRQLLKTSSQRTAGG